VAAVFQTLIGTSEREFEAEAVRVEPSFKPS